jgi:hypothetical protein
VVLAEAAEDYNLAFSHLLNAFHYYCYVEDKQSPFPQDRYDRMAVEKFLQPKASVNEIRFVVAFFDRRNKNMISHAGHQKQGSSVVGKEEYFQYKEKMMDLLRRRF